MLDLAQRKIHGLKHHNICDEHRVVRNMPPDADPPPKAVHDVALVLGIRWARRKRAAVLLEPSVRLMHVFPLTLTRSLPSRALGCSLMYNRIYSIDINKLPF